MVGRYLIISEDPEDRVIVSGPIKWDPVNEYDPGEGLDLILEAEAYAQGYTWS